MKLQALAFASAVAVSFLSISEAEACVLSCSETCTTSTACTTICNGSSTSCVVTTCGAYGVCSGGGGGCLTSVHPSAPAYMGEALSPHQNDALGSDTLQVVVFYKGAATNTATFGFEYRRPDSTTGWVYLNNLPTWDRKITTAQYNLNGAVPTGNFSVNGMSADGATSGVAFGLFWKDANDQYHLLKSNSSLLLTNASYIGVWPTVLDDTTFLVRAPQLGDRAARDAARVLLDGAKLLPVNGQYSVTVY